MSLQNYHKKKTFDTVFDKFVHFWGLKIHLSESDDQKHWKYYPSKTSTTRMEQVKN